MKSRPASSSTRRRIGDGDLVALGAALGFTAGMVWLGQPLLWVTVGVVVGLLLESLWR